MLTDSKDGVSQTLAFYLFSEKQLKIVYKMWLGNKVISFGKSPSLIFWLSDISSQTFYIASEERKALLEAKMLAVPGPKTMVAVFMWI